MKTSFRQKRKKLLNIEETYKVLTFRLKKLWFAVPLNEILKVIFIDSNYNVKYLNNDLFIHYKKEDIFILNVNEFIFCQPINQRPIINNTHLLLFNNNDKNAIALPIDSPPKIIVAKKSEFKKLPQKCYNMGNVARFSNRIIKQENQPIYILISLNKLAKT